MTKQGDLNVGHYGRVDVVARIIQAEQWHVWYLVPFTAWGETHSKRFPILLFPPTPHPRNPSDPATNFHSLPESSVPVAPLLHLSLALRLPVSTSPLSHTHNLIESKKLYE